MITVNVEKSNKCNGNYSAYLSFPYDEEIIGAVKGMPDRAWDNTNKVWEIPYGKLLDFLMRFSNHEIQLQGSIYEAEHDLLDDLQVSYDYDFKTIPYSYQVDGFNYGMNHNNWLLADEQGLGKTKQIIDIARAKKQYMNYQHCLIICGVNGLKWNWANEVKKHSNEDAYILGQKNRKKTGRIYIGSSEDKLECLDRIDELPYFLITNVETLRYGVKTGNKVKKMGKWVDEVIYPITDRISTLCNEGKINMVAIDEIHRCKNSKSQQGEQMLRVVAETNVAMTGTPLMNKPFDIYTIMKWLGYEKHSLYQFSQHYCVYGGWGGHEVTGYKNLEELNEHLNTVMLRRLKSDVFDLPEKVYIDEFVEMGSAQAKVYNRALNGLLNNMESVYTAVNPLSTLIRLRQATGYTGIVSDVKESAKLDRLEELAEEIVENGEKFVVFSNWTSMTDVIEERLAKYNPVVVTGETKDEDRMVLQNIFQENPECKCIIGTIGALGTGFTLTAGNNVIFVDHPWNRALFDQAVDRCHRIGTTKTVTVYNLLTKDTIDERVWEIVNAKGELSDAIVDGKIVKDKKTLVDYLLS